MAGGNTVYDSSFYHSQMGGSYRSAHRVLRALFGYFVPDSIVDLGCGTGTWLRAAKELGTNRVLGFDGRYVGSDLLQIEPREFVSIDLGTERPTFEGRFDLAMSLEVAEHLPIGRAESFVEDLCRASDTVLFSAAIPGQGGTHHVNEQFPSFWIPLFGRAGLRCFDVIRPEIWTDRTVEVWYRQNVLVFSKTRQFGNGKSPSPPLDLVHPELWENRGRLCKYLQAVWSRVGEFGRSARNLAR